MPASSARSPVLLSQSGDELPGTTIFRGRADETVLEAALQVLDAAPPRHLETPWGKVMSAAMTNCGVLGWYSDRAGYRYVAADPATGRPWPAMPPAMRNIACAAAAAAGFSGFEPEACLVNVYGPDARMGMHQDRDEQALNQPVVSVSFGRSARFRFGGCHRSDPSASVQLDHGDVLVFGGRYRLAYHGVTRLTGPPHPILGDRRINLTFRRVTRGA